MMYHIDREKKSKLPWRNSQNGQYEEQKTLLLQFFFVFFCVHLRACHIYLGIYILVYWFKDLPQLGHGVVEHVLPYPVGHEGYFSEKCASDSTEGEATLPI